MAPSAERIVARLMSREPPELEPGDMVWDPQLAMAVAALDKHPFVLAALHLANDDLEGCHRIVQEHPGDTTADYMHATVHRREGDYDNSGWWINCLSGHDLYKSRAELRAFVDECEAAAQDRSMSDVRLRKRQWNELVALLHWTMENCLTEDEAKMRQRWEDDALSDRSNDDGEDESEEWDSDAETGSEEDQEGMENSEGAPEGGSGGGSGRGTHGGGSAEDSEL